MSKKIWVVDDDIPILKVVQLILENAGYNVLTISSYSILEKELEKNLPNLILLDIWMSGKNGEEIAKRLKKEEKTHKIPIIMISALTDGNKIAKGLGVDDFLGKPFDMNDLLSKVEKHINK